MIELEGVERIFEVGDEKVHALRDLNLEVPAGEYLSLMGPSGSGKSTLLNIIGLLDRPSAGSYRIDGIDTISLDDGAQAQVRSHRIGFVFQAFHLVPRLTAAENVELPMVLAGVEPGERHARVADALARLGLSDRADHRPAQLSGGQRQRVAIARATIMRPTILLADEPTGNLDQVSGGQVIHTLESMNSDGLTLVVVTHDPDIGQRAHRRLRMIDGRISSDTGTAGRGQ
ncbi:MAG: ABC transporter ATP-binding protein [Pseudomonadota bacterium]